MSELIISVSGLRGVIGERLTPELAARFACAYAAGQAAGPMVVAYDGRTTGPMLVDAVRAALMGVGRDVLDARVAATPTVGVLLRQHQAAGAIQISASHNPPEYNGIKLFSPEGQVLSADEGEHVVQRFHDNRIDWVRFDQIGRAKLLDDTMTEHLRRVLDTVDTKAIQDRHYRVLLDSNHAAGGPLGCRLLHELGCDVLAVGDRPDGRFAHPPEPTADHLTGMCQQVRDGRADIGFCQDPDADRLAVIDEAGRYIGEEYTVALCVEQVLRQLSGPVVTNCSTSRMTEDLAGKAGVSFFRAPVGEANVVAVMKSHGAVFGGEGNGGPIDPRVGYIRDSFVGMAVILDAMAQRGDPVSRLADMLPRYAIHKTKQQMDRAKIAPALDALERQFSDAVPDRMDGLRLDWPDGRWLLIRASNTEPIVRVIAESPTLQTAKTLCAEAANVIQQV